MILRAIQLSNMFVTKMRILEFYENYITLFDYIILTQPMHGVLPKVLN
jgi:hypothetical protein